MHLSSLEKARSRLRSAQRAFIAMQGAQDEPDTLCDHWVEFLVAWKGTYNHIEQAAKSTPQERQWFGRVARERRQDPLLNYVFEARNDEEHGLDRSAKPHGGLAFMRADSDMVVHGMKFDPEARTVTLCGEDGEALTEPMKLSAPGVALGAVKARGGRIIPPPPMPDDEKVPMDPIIVAGKALHFAEALVVTAEALHKP